MRRLGRRQLDRRLDTWRQLPPAVTARPVGGWVRAIRDSLGMTAADLGVRAGLTPRAVARLEACERDGTARLDGLRRAADALGCDLVYALVPRVPLEQTVQDRARLLARHELDQIDATMRLEGHGIDAEMSSDLLDALTDRFANDRRLWRIQDN